MSRRKIHKIWGFFSNRHGDTGTKSFRSEIRGTKDRTFIPNSQQKGVFYSLLRAGQPVALSVRKRFHCPLSSDRNLHPCEMGTALIFFLELSRSHASFPDPALRSLAPGTWPRFLCPIFRFQKPYDSFLICRHGLLSLCSNLPGTSMSTSDKCFASYSSFHVS